MLIMAFASVCNAADGFGIPGLKKHALSKLEMLLARYLNSLDFNPELDPIEEDEQRLEPFTTMLLYFFNEVEEPCDDDRSKMSEVMRVVVRICSKCFAVIRQFPTFKDLACTFPALYQRILYYAAFHGGDILLTDPRTGERVFISEGV